MPCWFRYAVAIVVALCGGCTAQDSRYYREGIGTNLVVAVASDQANLEDAYVGLICHRATGDNTCSDWNQFVVAGMNDIDERCDAYLAWLDARRRDIAPVLQEIGDAQTAASTLMIATGAGEEAIGIASAAFGFARNSFNNFNSRLLFEVNHSTVQAIVLHNQTRLREEVRLRRVGGRPEAIYALRQYLRVCMPFTIETEINNTLTTFEAGGPGALALREPLVAATTIGPEPVAPRMTVAPRRFVVPPLAPGNPLTPLVAEPLVRYSEPQLKSALRAICVSGAEVANLQIHLAAARIKAFQQYQKEIARDPISAPTGKMTQFEVAAVAADPACDTSKSMNYFEAKNFPGGIASAGLVQKLNRHLSNQTKLDEDALADVIRTRIPEVRASLKSKLTLQDPNLSDQLTLDLISAL